METKKINYKVELNAGFATYLTLSYIFLLNPILLAQTGMNISAAFFATVISAFISTLLMGVWAKLPFAVAPAPSITTFFVSFVCIQQKLPWQVALLAVVLSGILSILMTKLSIRAKLIEPISVSLRTGIILGISGFLVANGFKQAKIISYSNGVLDFINFSFESLTANNSILLYVGLLVTLLFQLKRFRISGAPILGIFIATVLASFLGIKGASKAELSLNMFDSFFAFKDIDFSILLDLRFLISMIIFFIIDFFSGIGKYIGLFSIMGEKRKELEKDGIGKALYIDGLGNIIGGVLGASSLAVFISSAVGIRAGGKTGWTSIFTAIFMFLGLFTIPLIGAIPVQATTGILIYIGYLLIPIRDLNTKNGKLNKFDVLISIISFLISFLTFGLDKAILFVFLIYTIKLIVKGIKKEDMILVVTTLFLLLAIIAREIIK